MSDNSENMNNGSNGKRKWRSLDELANAPDFDQYIKNEYPHGAVPTGMSRSAFLKIMGASLALAGLTGCRQLPQTKIVPYVTPPEEVTQGVPLFYASTLPIMGYGRGALVETHEGRPTKIEGNPDHPSSLGSSDIFMQAEILRLYDPDRSQSPMNMGQKKTWDDFIAALKTALKTTPNGSGFTLLLDDTASPTVYALLSRLKTKYPQARILQHSPIVANSDIVPIYSFNKAERIVAIDSDFLYSEPHSLRYVRDFSGNRTARKHGKPLNRLYVAEASPSLTGASADHRIAVHQNELSLVAASLYDALKGGGGVKNHALPANIKQWVSAVAKDLLLNKGKSVAVGLHAEAINQILNAVGNAVAYINEPTASARKQLGVEPLARIPAETKALLILGGNPVYTTAVSENAASDLKTIPFTAHLSYYFDETSSACQWHIPEAHPLEAWGDAYAYDGVASIIQPVIEPLYPAKSKIEILAALLEDNSTGYDLVKKHWQTAKNEPNFEQSWRKWLHNGVIDGTKASSIDARPRAVELNPAIKEEARFTAVVRPDLKLLDGRYSNLGWLQELPDPITKLVWDNAIWISPDDAKEYKLRDGDIVTAEIPSPTSPGSTEKQTFQAPVIVVPGVAKGVLLLQSGYGRTSAGKVGDNVGFDVNKLRQSSSQNSIPVYQLTKTNKKHNLVSTQNHHSMEGRDILRSGTFADFERGHNPHEPEGHHESEGASLYPLWEYNYHKWGMVIDLTKCIGCNACVIACQAENNIQVVGKDQVGKGREMHWIRADRYYEGEPDNPQIQFMPVPCMQCEEAPCEPVCPVGATVHNAEGLNEMVYNRCIGTRYCSNNCPYKVRRFNFFEYPDHKTPILKLLRNPNVTLRERGVMEKCNYCVQRINNARINAKKENRKVKDGEATTACQAACPAQAIVFGDLNDEASRAAKLTHEPHNYGLLTELGTRPRTTYLGLIRNPNPELTTEKPHGNSNKH